MIEAAPHLGAPPKGPPRRFVTRATCVAAELAICLYPVLLQMSITDADEPALQGFFLGLRNAHFEHKEGSSGCRRFPVRVHP